jgi:hypothetical protein
VRREVILACPSIVDLGDVGYSRSFGRSVVGFVVAVGVGCVVTVAVAVLVVVGLAVGPGRETTG